MEVSMGNTIDGGFSHGLILRKKKSLITTFFSLLHGLFHVIPFIVLLFGWHGCSICLGTKKRYRPPHLERGMPSDPFGSQYHVGTKHHKCKPTWSVEKNHGWRRICIHEYIPYVHIFIYNTRIYIYNTPTSFLFKIPTAGGCTKGFCSRAFFSVPKV
jgi:hypothetical protein